MPFFSGDSVEEVLSFMFSELLKGTSKCLIPYQNANFEGMSHVWYYRVGSKYRMATPFTSDDRYEPKQASDDLHCIKKLFSKIFSAIRSRCSEIEKPLFCSFTAMTVPKCPKIIRELRLES